MSKWRLFVSYIFLTSHYYTVCLMRVRARILVQVTMYRWFLIGRDGHLDQSEAYDIS